MFIFKNLAPTEKILQLLPFSSKIRYKLSFYLLYYMENKHYLFISQLMQCILVEDILCLEPWQALSQVDTL